ncbi:MAG: dihydrolipoyl dehydrogenase [Sporomusaceae bacterium]|nr:dihydrolipoyl dehydrogenase [Sporomusaceae bacterium]
MKIAIIGGGPAGYIAALRAAQLGGQAVLVEYDSLGGTCLNRGCIPTKAMLKSAHIFNDVKSAAEFGILAGAPAVDYGKVVSRKNTLVKQLQGGITNLLKAAGVEQVKGRARFVTAHTAAVTLADGSVYQLEADRFIIAAGSVPAMPPVAGLAGCGAMTSDEIFGLAALPKSILILGGGVIGVEFATIFNAFGSAVTVVEMADRLVPGLDADISRELLRSLKAAGVNVLTAHRAEAAAKTAAGYTLTVSGADGSQQTLAAEQMLVCVGRQANTAGLGLENIGVVMERGNICVDAQMRTNLAHIYAAGDVNGGVQLAHVASREGELAAEAAMGHSGTAPVSVYPNCIFTFPEIGAAGLTEQQAIERGYKAKIGRFPFAANGKALVERSMAGFVKVVADADTDRLLGLHIIGPQATAMLGEGVLAIQNGLTLAQFAEAIRPHPTLNEVLAEAALQADNRAFHMPNRPR